MCSRFHINAPTDRLMARFGLRVPPPLPDNPLVRPTGMALAIDGQQQGRLMIFGLKTGWAPRPLLNARAETVASKATFRPLLDHRVIVPATEYVEWRTDARGGKHLNRIRLCGGNIFALAGLHDDEQGLCLLTCAPSPDVAPVHNRMPVILGNPDAEARWLDPTRPFSAVADLLIPCPHRLERHEDTAPPPAQGCLF